VPEGEQHTNQTRYRFLTMDFVLPRAFQALLAESDLPYHVRMRKAALLGRQFSDNDFRAIEQAGKSIMAPTPLGIDCEEGLVQIFPAESSTTPESYLFMQVVNRCNAC
jgi:hypothetical protein